MGRPRRSLATWRSSVLLGDFEGVFFGLQIPKVLPLLSWIFLGGIGKIMKIRIIQKFEKTPPTGLNRRYWRKNLDWTPTYHITFIQNYNMHTKYIVISISIYLRRLLKSSYSRFVLNHKSPGNLSHRSSGDISIDRPFRWTRQGHASSHLFSAPGAFIECKRPYEKVIVIQNHPELWHKP